MDLWLQRLCLGYVDRVITTLSYLDLPAEQVMAVAGLWFAVKQKQRRVKARLHALHP